MNARVKSATLWGIVGGLVFAILAQGSIALDAVDLTLAQSLVGSVIVAGATAVVTYRYEHRVVAWAETRGR
ncbi:hypothetical protein [Halovivax gelatinilyticus]|uniref:hypothetical protein n=1 Tax=Halovivax gelatinilyticus TaxID=2961597 RepID=UPI0020CA91D9|nr:hypothetical protein [Halovivax gelatinilyticus]